MITITKQPQSSLRDLFSMHNWSVDEHMRSDIRFLSTTHALKLVGYQPQLVVVSYDLSWSHMLISTLWQLRCIIRNGCPCCVQKMGKKNVIFCFFLFRRSVHLCGIIRCHTIGRVRVPNSSLFVQQRMKHVPVDPHRPCGTSRDDVHAICCLFVCCCFIVII